MATIAIVFHSGAGHTKKTAEAVADGARSVEGAQVKVFEIVGDDIEKGRYSNQAIFDELATVDAIIFGSPTYMGSVSGQFKCFADASSGPWRQGAWKDKWAGGFSSSGTSAGDKTMTHHYMFTLAAQHGMLWVTHPQLPSQFVGSDEGLNIYGHYAGVGVVGGMAPNDGTPGEGDLKTAFHYGARIAGLAAKIAPVVGS